jgi:hypothetical protein
MQKLDHNISFQEKGQFFSPKIVEISENCDHSIDSTDEADSTSFAISLSKAAILITITKLDKNAEGVNFITTYCEIVKRRHRQLGNQVQFSFSESWKYQ